MDLRPRFRSRQWIAHLARSFSRADSNQNGRITHAELEAWVKRKPELWAMLSVNTGLSAEECQSVACRVAWAKCARLKFRICYHVWPSVNMYVRGLQKRGWLVLSSAP